MPQIDLPTFSMQSVLALLFTATSCYLWATNQIVPDNLLLVNTVVVGFFFGNKNGQQQTVNAINAAAVERAAEPVLAKPYIPTRGEEK